MSDSNKNDDDIILLTYIIILLHVHRDTVFALLILSLFANTDSTKMILITKFMKILKERNNNNSDNNCTSVCFSCVFIYCFTA